MRDLISVCALPALPPTAWLVFSLTRQEQILITALLLALLAGVITKHYRDEYRARHPVVPATAAASSPPPYWKLPR